MSKNFNDFIKWYKSNTDVKTIVNKIKDENLSANPSTSIAEITSIASFDLTISILQSYHNWLLDNFEITPKDNC